MAVKRDMDCETHVRIQTHIANTEIGHDACDRSGGSDHDDGSGDTECFQGVEGCVEMLVLGGICCWRALVNAASNVAHSPRKHENTATYTPQLNSMITMMFSNKLQMNVFEELNSSHDSSQQSYAQTSNSDPSEQESCTDTSSGLTCSGLSEITHIYSVFHCLHTHPRYIHHSFITRPHRAAQPCQSYHMPFQ